MKEIFYNADGRTWLTSRLIVACRDRSHRIKAHKLSKVIRTQIEDNVPGRDHYLKGSARFLVKDNSSNAFAIMSRGTADADG